MRKDAGKPSVDTWTGLYKSGWQKVACVEAFSHPAKFARGLIQYIYQHAIKEGFLVPGNTVLDVFAGTALGAYDAMTHGLHFVGVELEQPFHDIGSGCDCTGISKADWVRFYGRWPRMRYAEDRYWCPQCLREAGEMQRSHDMFTMSASYVRDVHTKDNKATFATRHTNHPSGQIQTTRPHRYSGNLGLWARKGYAGARLIRGDSRALCQVLEKADCVVSSPPYVNNTIRGGETARIPIGRSPGRLQQQRLPTPEDTGYGQHPAQLGNLPPGSVANCLRSDKRQNVTKDLGLLYVLLFQPDNPIASILEIPIFAGILSLLAGTGMPVFTIDFDNQVIDGQEKVTVVIRDGELPTIENLGIHEQTSKAVFQLTLPRTPIALYRAIDASTILEAIQLNGERTAAGRALTFDTRTAELCPTFNRAKLSSATAHDSSGDCDFLTALLTGLGDIQIRGTGMSKGRGMSKASTHNRTIATPLFGITTRHGERLSALFALQGDSVAFSEDGGATKRAQSSPSFLQLIRLGIERFFANQADTVRRLGLKYSINNMMTTLEDPVAGCTTKSVLCPGTPLPWTSEVLPTLTTDQINLSYHKKSLPSMVQGSISKLGGNSSKKELDFILSSPPYANGCAHTGGADPQPQHIQGGPLPYVAYGQDAAQLGAMALGSLADAIVSSPPYAAISMNDNTPTINTPPRPGDVRQYQRKAPIREYGAQPGQLAAMPTGEVAAVVSSPPHGGTTPVDGRAITDAKTHTRPLGLMSDLKHGYGESAGQLANDTSTTFWEAARTIPSRPMPSFAQEAWPFGW